MRLSASNRLGGHDIKGRSLPAMLRRLARLNGGSEVTTRINGYNEICTQYDVTVTRWSRVARAHAVLAQGLVTVYRT